ncbi:MAG: phosphate ABC transporter permease PstA, partial [Primorskyibacter sp.]
MTDSSMVDAQPAASKAPTRSLHAQDDHTRRRNAAETRFRMYGMAAITVGMVFLAVLVTSILSNGMGAFRQTFITVEVFLDPAKLDKRGTGRIEDIKKVSTFGYAPLVHKAIWAEVQQRGIETDFTRSKDMKKLVSASAASQVRDYVLANPSAIGQRVEFRVLASSRVDGYLKGRVLREHTARDKNIDAGHLDLTDALVRAGVMALVFNLDFILGSDASDTRSESAGMGVAMLGSFYMMLVVLVLSLPIGVATSIYLEEFAPQNRFTDLIEVNISNLAAVPSIVFGILGLAVFIQFMHLPQSAPLVGGLVLTLMTLPTIIISTRASLKAVPPSIRDAALGVGASKMQTVFHHVLPLAAPGILTGTIIGLAQALGETAPLLLIGMVGYIASNYPDGVASGFLDPNSAMPAQIYEWAKRSDPAFYERAWGGIIILLVFLL